MNVHSFESMSARDGDGIRFTVFLSGCPLRCVYCHNPDTQRSGGTPFEPLDIVKKAKRYKPYFKYSGGVTFSGGEPLLQAEEIVKTGKLLEKEGIRFALDTSLAVEKTKWVEEAIDLSSFVIADLKFPTKEETEKYAGRGFEKIIENLEYIKKIKKRLIMRTVVVPDINSDLDTLSRYIPLVERFSPEVWELLPFHTMGFFKYEEMGIENPLKDTPSLEREELEKLKNALREKTNIKIK